MEKRFHTIPVRVKIIRIQNGETDIFECTGSKRTVNGKIVVSFVQDVENNEQNTYLLKITPTKMEWAKKGKNHTTSEFADGEKTLFKLATPHGTLRLDIETHEYLLIQQDNGDIELRIEYTLLQDQSLVGEIILQINVITLGSDSDPQT